MEVGDQMCNGITSFCGRNIRVKVSFKYYGLLSKNSLAYHTKNPTATANAIILSTSISHLNHMHLIAEYAEYLIPDIRCTTN